MRALLDISHSCAKALLASLCLVVALLCAQPAFADPTVDATHVSDPSTASGNASILGEGTTNTLNAGRIWADKSVYAGDATLDGVTLSNDSDFLVVFSALGSSIERTGVGFDGAPASPIDADSALTFSDPLGEYMEPAGDVTLMQFGQQYAYERNVDSDSSMSFVPVNDQSVVNLSYGDVNLSFKLSDISIAATKDADANRWVMNVSIPSQALPLYLSILGYGNPDANGNQSLRTFTTNAGEVSSLPLRIAYPVGIAASCKNADGTLDFTKISPEYQTSHLVTTDAGTRLDFSSNRYDDPAAVISPDDTYGNAIVSIAPAADNSFYYFQDHLTIYRDGTPGTYNGDPAIFGNVANPVLDLYDIQSDPRGTFYVSRNYYRRSGTGGVHSAYEVVAYAGRDLLNTVCYYDPQLKGPVSEAGPNTVVATNIGCACLGNVAKFRTKKASNPTGTASYAYYGAFIPDPAASGSFDIEAHYGNNGVMSIAYAPSAALELDGMKRFEINGAVWSPSATDYGSFEFRVLPSRGNPVADPVAPAGFVASSDASGAIDFAFGVYAQPGTYRYDVREIVPATSIPGLSYDSAFYTVQVEAYADASGTIQTRTSLLRNGVPLPSGSRIEFLNVYDTDVISTQVQGQVQLSGAPLDAGQFAFELEAVSGTGASGTIDCPLPVATQAVNGSAGAFAFGPITFTQAGQYVYRVRQIVPAQTAADYRYDDSSYLVAVAVRHSADGPLYAVASIARESAGGNVDVDAVAFSNSVVTPTLAVDKVQVSAEMIESTSMNVTSGDVFTYCLTVTNPSGIEVHDVLLFDEVPAGLLLASELQGDAEGPYLYEGRLYWIIKSLAGGERFSVEFSVRVPAAPVDTRWLNTAAVAYPNLVDASQTMQAQSSPVQALYIVPAAPAPDEPGDSDDPSEPSDEPANPSIPDDPGNPDEPPAPDNPEEPPAPGDEPESPPAPEEPGKPEEPLVPGNEPPTPGDDQGATSVEEPSTNASTIPAPNAATTSPTVSDAVDTRDRSLVALPLVIGILALLAALLCAGARRRLGRASA